MNGWNILLAVENGIGEMQALVRGSNIEWGPLCTDGYTVGTLRITGGWKGSSHYMENIMKMKLIGRA